MSDNAVIEDNAIILNAIEDADGLLVHIPRDHRYAYKIDGEVYHPQRDKTVRVASRESIVAFKTRRVEVNYASQQEGVEGLSIDEYKDRERSLTKNRRWDEVSDGYKWDSLDDEFEYRKFAAKYTLVYAKRHVEIPVRIGASTYPESPSKHIRTVVQFGSNVGAWCVYSQQAAILDALDREIAKHGLKKKGSNRDLGAREVKIYSYRKDEVSVFGSSFQRQWACRNESGPLDGMLARLRADEAMVSEAMEFYAKLHGEPFAGPTVGVVADELRTLARTASGLELKKKSWGRGRALGDALVKLAKKVESGDVTPQEASAE